MCGAVPMKSQDINNAFDYAIDQIKNEYMLMHICDRYFHFKHAVTREYIKIPKQESFQ